MTKKRSEPRKLSTPTPFEQARDELFSHILRCGVLEATPEHQKEWFDDTMLYLAERARGRERLSRADGMHPGALRRAERPFYWCGQEEAIRRKRRPRASRTPPPNPSSEIGRASCRE